MRNSIGFLILGMGAALTAGFLADSALAAPPPKPPLTIAARLTVEVPLAAGGVILTDDGRGEYFDSVDGVQCVFFNPDAGGSGDLVFDTNYNATASSPPSRGFKYQFVLPYTGCPITAVGSVPPDGVYTTSHLTVGGPYWRTQNGGYSVYKLPIGSTALFCASFSVTGTIPLRFSAPSGPNGDCTMPVRVTRGNSDTWTIEAASTDLTAIYQTVSRKDGAVPTSYWTMPFIITVHLK